MDIYLKINTEEDLLGLINIRNLEKRFDAKLREKMKEPNLHVFIGTVVNILEHNDKFIKNYKGLEKTDNLNKRLKIIKDLKNKYGSWLVETQTRKLTKIVDQEEVLKLKAKLELLTELEKKLGL